jgi:hypothetical protein
MTAFFMRRYWSSFRGLSEPDPQTIIKRGQFSMEIPGQFSGEIDTEVDAMAHIRASGRRA